MYTHLADVLSRALDDSFTPINFQSFEIPETFYNFPVTQVPQLGLPYGLILYFEAFLIQGGR